MHPDTARILEKMILIALSVAQGDAAALRRSAPLRDVADSLAEAVECLRDYAKEAGAHVEVAVDPITKDEMENALRERRLQMTK